MKYCPTCETRYDEEILRFCMKDGTPLLEDEEPIFVEMPSENLESADDDDAGDVTVIRRNISVPPLPPEDFEEESFEPEQPPPPRIVVPTSPEPARYQARVIPPYLPPPRSNTFKVVILTMLGTTAVLGIGAIGFWFLRNDPPANTNVNLNANLGNVNTNVNTNLGFDGNFNFNTNTAFNANFNSNVNSNANLKTPTPTPRPSPSATPSPSPTRTPDDDGTPIPTRPPFPTPTPIIIRPGGSPSPRINPTPSNRPVNSGVLNGRALSLPTPTYPPIARQVKAAGQVTVQVAVDELGNVVSAKAISGHPLLRQSAETAARQSKISPVRIDNQNVRSSGVLVYNFRNR